MASGNHRLKMILSYLAPFGRMGQMKHAAGDQRTIPAAAILVLQPEQIAIDIDTRRSARAAQEHQREQCVGFWPVASRMFGQQSAEPDCLLTNFFAHELLA